MSIIGLVSLICALGIATLTVDPSPWHQGSFIVFLCLSVATFAASSLKRPSLLWEVIDDYRGRRKLEFHQRRHISRGARL